VNRIKDLVEKLEAIRLKWEKKEQEVFKKWM